MKLKLLLLINLTSLFAFSQETKTYKGKYEYAYGYGIAVYQYYENKDYERIYNGDFAFENDEINFNTIIIGRFENNLQEGEWYYKRYNKHSPNSLIINGNYFKGYKNGIWSYNEITSPNSDPDNAKQNIYYVNFKNDTIVNDFSLENIEGQFNNYGEFIGKWILTDGDYEYLAEFKKNTLIKLIERKKSTGLIISKYIPNNIEWDNDNFYAKLTKDKRNIYGLSESNNKSNEQIRSINRFFNSLTNEFYPFDSRNYVFLSKSEITLPKFLFKKDEIVKEEKVPKKEISTKSIKEQLFTIRSVIYKKECSEFGNVVFKVKINDKGKVLEATPNITHEKTTSKSECLFKVAKEAIYSKEIREELFNSQLLKESIKNNEVLIIFKPVIRD